MYEEHFVRVRVIHRECSLYLVFNLLNARWFDRATPYPAISMLVMYALYALYAPFCCSRPCPPRR